MFNRLFAALMTVIMLLGTSSTFTYTRNPKSTERNSAVIRTMKTENSNVFDSTAQGISSANAEDIVLFELGLTREQVSFDPTELDYERGKQVWEVELNYGNTEYDFYIDFQSGKVLHREEEVMSRPTKSYPTPAPVTPSEPIVEEITKDDAVSIALEHSGLKLDQVKKLKVEKDYEKGVLVYELEFEEGVFEYEYEISASDGKILKWDKEIDD